ncbi:MAG: hypothetical protein ACM359_06790 [Bacillota bacterium]
MMVAIGENTGSNLFLAWTVLQFVFDLIVGLWLASVQAKNKRIESLEATVKATAEQLISSKFESVEAKLKTPITQLSTLVQQIEQRLKRGDEDFDRLTDRWQKVELQLVRAMGEVKDSFTATLQAYATKHDVDALAKRLDAIPTRSKA